MLFFSDTLPVLDHACTDTRQLAVSKVQQRRATVSHFGFFQCFPSCKIRFVKTVIRADSSYWNWDMMLTWNNKTAECESPYKCRQCQYDCIFDLLSGDCGYDKDRQPYDSASSGAFGFRRHVIKSRTFLHFSYLFPQTAAVLQLCGTLPLQWMEQRQQQSKTDYRKLFGWLFCKSYAKHERAHSQWVRQSWVYKGFLSW